MTPVSTIYCPTLYPAYHSFSICYFSVFRGGDDKDDSGDEGDAENKKFKDQLSGLFVIIVINIKPIKKMLLGLFFGNMYMYDSSGLENRQLNFNDVK